MFSFRPTNNGYETLPFGDESFLEEGNSRYQSIEIVNSFLKADSKCQLCISACCADNSNFKEFYTTTDNAILPLVGRSAGQKPFIPQSYNYQDFEKNQIKAIGQKFLRLTLEVVQTVFAQGYKDVSNKNNNLVSNQKVLQNCRFFPEYKGLNQEEIIAASEGEIILPGPLLESVIGCLAQETNTICGQEFLLVRGSNPINNKHSIRNRQSVIRKLVCDESLCTELQNALKIYGRYENDFCSRLTPDATKLPGRIESYLKFALLDIPESVGRPLNAYIRDSTTLLSANNCIKTVQDGVAILLLCIIASALLLYISCLLCRGLFSPSLRAALARFVARYIGQTGAAISLLESLDSTASKTAASVLGLVICLAKAPDSYGYWRADMSVKIALQAKVAAVAQCIRAMQRVHRLLGDRPDLAAGLEQFQHLHRLVGSDNSKVQKLLAALHSPTLDAPSQYFHFGPVIVAWSLLLDKEVRQLVMDAILAMGEVDCDLTLARRVVGSTAQRPCCLPILVDGDEAVLEIDGGDFPPAQCVFRNNSLALPALSILTAENGAGKTTFALSWMNIVLSTQSLGVAACGPNTRLTVFDSVMTSMGVSDNNLESSHQSHERYHRELLAKIDNHPGHKVFVLLDELYRGTHEEKAATRLKELANKLNLKSKQIKIIFITHFKTFAQDPTVTATRFTTRKNDHNKPSGVLEEGVYEFQTPRLVTK